jgi:hypothetical protein
MAILWLLTGLGGGLVAQENIAVWKFPMMGATSSAVSADCVSDLIQSSDCELDVLTDGWTIVAYDFNNANTELCGNETDNTKGLRLVNTNGNFETASIVFKISTGPFSNIQLSYDHRVAAAGGYATETWSYSTNGSNFTDMTPIEGGTTTYATETVDFSSISALNGVSSVWFKLTVSGATVSNAATIIDNVVFSGSALTCLTPINMTAVADDAPTEAVISWEPQGTNEESYTLVYYTGSLNAAALNLMIENNSSNVFANVTSPYTLTGLTANTNYYIYVRANCGGDDNSLWASTTVRTPTVCTISGLTSSDVAGSTASLAWTTESPATQIRVFTASKNNPWEATDGLFLEETVNGTSYDLTGLSFSTTYHVYARSVCSANNISETVSTSFTTNFADNVSGLTVNDGTNTNSYVPIYGYWADNISKSQFIIPASSLDDMVAGTIYQLKFYSSQSSISWGAARFSVYIGETSATTLSSTTPDYSGMTEVYSGALSVSGGMMQIDLATPYLYNGGNLMIGVLETTSGSYSSSSWYGVSQSSNTSIGGYGTSISYYQFLPKTTFTYVAAVVSCPKPTNLAAGNVSATSATITWLAGGEETAWAIKYGPAGFDVETAGTEVSVETTPSYELTGLAANTEYDVYVKAVCSDTDESGWRKVSFATPCIAITEFPWTETFESYASGNFAASCWANEHITGSGTYIFAVNTTTIGTNTTHQLRLPDMSSGTQTKLVLPEMELSDETRYVFSMDVYRSNYSTYDATEGIRVYASTDGEIEGATELGFIPRQYTASSSTVDAVDEIGWYSYKFDIPFTGTCYIVLRGESRYRTATYMDNFVVREGSSAAEITAFSFAEDAEAAVINSTEATVTCLVSYSTESLNGLVPTIAVSENASIAPASGVAQDFTGPVTYTVTAEDGITTKQWTVNVSKVETASTAKDILSFTFSNQQGESVIDPENHTVLAYAAWNYDFANNIAPTITVSPQATIYPVSDSAINFAAPVTYTVTAEDLSTQQWTVTIINDPNACVNPLAASFEVSDLTSSTATVAWVRRYTETSYNVKVSTTAMTDMTATADVYDGVVNDTVIALTGLAENTMYHVYVQSNCDNAEGWASINFRTIITPATIPYVYAFEDATENNSWVLENGSQSSKWYIGSVSSNGGNGLYISNDSGTTNAYTTGTAAFVYAYRTISLPADADYVISYDWKANGEGSYDYIRAWLAPSTFTFTPGQLPDGTNSPYYYTSTTPDGWISLDGGNKLNLSTSWQNATHTLSIAYGVYNLVFLWANDGSGGTQPPASVDNISITQITCPVVANITATNVTTNSADIEWTERGSATAWSVVVSETALTEAQLASATAQGVTAPSYSATGLTPNTPYYVYVRANCSDDDNSDWVSKTFRTGCGENDLPYTADFNEYTATDYNVEGTVPYCWSVVFEGTDDGYAPHVTNSSYYAPTTNDKYLVINVAQNETEGTNSYALMPLVTGGYASTFVSFDLRAGFTNRGTLSLGYMLNGEYTNLTAVTLTTSKSTFEYVVPNTVPEGAVLALKLTATTTSNLSVGIDNVYVRPASNDNTLLSYAASTEQGDAICGLDNEAHTISVELRGGYVAGADISQTIVTNDENATVKQQIGSNFVDLPASFTWFRTTADTTITYKVIAENGDEQIYTATLTVESCPAPLTVESEQTSPTNVNCTWTTVDGTTSWNFYYTTTQLTPAELNALTSSDYTTVTTASASATVEGETTYYWYVRTDCDGSYSAWLEGTFSTWETCVPPTNLETTLVGDNDVMITWDVQDNLPVAESIINDSFERDDVNGGDISFTNSTASLAWSIVSTGAHSGSKCLKSASGTHSSTSQISTTVNITEASPFSFWYKVSSESGWDEFSFAIDGTDEISEVSGEVAWTQYSTTLAVGTHTLAWKYTKDGSASSGSDCAWIDDIVLPSMVPGGNSSVVLYRDNVELATLPATTTSYTDEGLVAGNYCYTIKTICREGSESEVSAPVCQDINDCLAVTNLSADDITATSAVISWTRGAETSWNLKVNDGTPVALTETTEGVTVNGDVISYALAGLEPMSVNIVAIQSNCDGTLGQNWANVEFTTDRVPATAPYICDFEDAVQNNGWVLVNGSTNEWYIDGAVNHGGANGLYISNDGGTSNAYNTGSTTFAYAYRTMSLETGDYVISYDWKAVGESSSYDFIRVWLAPASFVFTPGQAPNGGTSVYTYASANNPEGWISLDGSHSLNQSSSWQSQSLTVSISEGTYNLVFMWANDGGGGTQPPAAIDNVSVIEVSCPRVANIVANPENITDNSAVITWTERGSAEAWEIIVSSSSLSDSQLASAESVSVTETTYSATGLDAVTTYHVYVRANCGASDNSEWISSTFTTVAACATPDGLQANNVSAASATITWNGYTASQWTLEYRIGTSGTWTPVEGIDEASYTLTTTGNTTYNVRIKAVCGENASDYSAIYSFTTPCDALTIDADNPYTEGFESTTTYEIPDCWERIVSYNSGSYEYPYVGSSSSNAHTGSRYLYMYVPSSTAANENIIALPPMNNINTLEISMWARYSTAPQSFEIGYIRNGEFTSVNTIALTNTYSKYTVYMSEAPADAQSIAIRAYHGTSYAYVYVDDINVSVIPTCVEPAYVVASDITSETASISWTDVIPATEWQYQLNGGEIVDVDAKPIELTGLSSNTAYTVNVRTVCGTDEFSSWSTVSFRTACDAIADFPWSEDFESVTTPSLPSCWMSVDANNDGDYWKTFSNSSKEAGIYTDGNSGNNNDYLILPAFELNGNYLLSYDVRTYSSGEPNDYRVVLSTTGFAPEDFNVVLKPLEQVSNTSYETREVAINGYNGPVYIAMHVPQGGLDGWYLYFDNFNIREMSSDNTILSYEASTEQGNAICNLDNEAHTISVVLRAGYVAGAAISQTIVPNDQNATVQQQRGSNFVALPASFSWYMTTADTTINYKVIAENGDEQIYTAEVSIESCGAPLNLVSEQTSPTNVNLSWTAVEGTSLWNFYCSTTQLTQSELEALSDYTTLDATSTAYSVTAGATYYWYVRTDCNGSYSSWLGDSFTAWEECLAPTNVATTLVNDNDIVITWNVQDNLPVVETIINDGFERTDINGGDISYTNSTGGLAWSIVSAGAHSGSNCLKSASGNNSSTSQISMTVDLSSESPFSFWYKVSSESGYDEFSFAIDGTDEISEESGEVAWTQYATTLPAGSHTLAWKYTKDVSVSSGSDCAWIDDISINTAVVGGNSSVVIYKDDVELTTIPATQTSYTDAGLTAGTYCYKVKTVCREGNESEFSADACQEINSCLAVTGLDAADITANSATISWTRGTDETAWNITTNGGSPIALTETTEGVTVNGDFITYVLEGLEPATVYTIAVQADCGASLAQGLTSIQITTDRIPAALPYTCDFEDATENVSWILENGTLTNKWYIGTAANNGGANGLYISSDNGVSNSYNNGSETYVYAYRPINVEEAGNYDISFDWRSNGESSWDVLNAFAVPATIDADFSAGNANGMTSSSNTAPTGWIAIADQTYGLYEETTWQHSEKSVALEVGRYNIVFFWKNDDMYGDQTPAAVDNISIERSTFTITASSANEIFGTISPSGEIEVADGASQTFTMTPLEGFALSSLLVDGYDRLSQVVDNTYTFENIHADHTIVAYFDAEHIITATAGNGGTIDPAGQVSVGNNGNMTFTITADDGYIISSVMVDNVEQITDVTVMRTTYNYHFTNVTDDHIITAAFVLADPHTIVATAGEGGSIVPSGNVTVLYNASQEFQLVPDEGYSLSGLVVDNVNAIYSVVNNTYTFNNVIADHTISASFTVNNYNLTIHYVYANSNATAAPDYTETLAYGATYSVESPVIANYLADQLVVAGTMPAQDLEVVVTYSYDGSEIFTITATAGLGGSIAPSGEVPVNGGENQSFTITANEGYNIASVIVDAETANEANVTSQLVDGVYTFLGVTANHTINATFSEIGYNLTIHYVYADNTTAAPDHTETLTLGAEYSVASPVIAGYTADQLTVAGTMPAQDVEVTVVYNVNSYTLTIHYVYADNTTAAPDHTETVAYNTAYSVESPVIAGYTADQLTVAGTMPAQDVEVTVVYNINSYNLTIHYVYADNTTAAPDYTETVAYDAAYSVESPVIAGYTADQLTVAGTMPAQDVELTVVYNVNSYTLTIHYVYADNTTAAPDHTETVAYDAAYSVASPAITGYTADQLTVEGTMPAQDVEVTVIYNVNSYTLTIHYVYADNTTAAPDYTETVAYDVAYSVESPAITGYTADQTIVEGTMPADDVTVTVTYTINTYTITATAGENGTIDPSGNVEVTYGADQSFTITPADNYRVLSLLVDGAEATSDIENGIYTFTNVTANHTISVTFVHEDATTYTITATAGENGTIAPNGVIEVVEGEDKSFTIAANTGYSIATVMVDETENVTETVIAADGVYTFQNVSANHTIDAAFSINSYNLTIHYVYADNTTAAPDHTETVVYNTAYSVESPAITGYTADQTVVEGTMLAQDVEVTVVYNVNSYNLTIHYVFADDTEASADYTAQVAYGTPYSVESPVIAGYTADQLTVEGTMPAQDVELTVVYNANSYSLTIHYVYADNTTAAPDHTETVVYNTAYSVESPVIDGYTADQPVVEGTMPAGDHEVTVIYNANSYTLTIHYVFADDTEASADYTAQVAYGTPYSVESPVIAGYTADQTTVAGTMPAEDVTVTVRYTANTYTLTIHYVYADETEASADYTAQVVFGTPYSVESPVIAGYTADQPVVAGTMPAGDHEVTVTYNANSYTLTIHYVYADDTEASADYTAQVAYGTPYSVESPVIAGYTADQLTVAGTMPAEDVTVTVRYTVNSYTLTIHYVYADNTTAAPDHTETVVYNTAYSVESPVIAGYTASQLTVAGTMPAENVEVTVIYNASSYTLTIHYVYANNTTAAPDYTATLNYGATYSVESIYITGYTADQPVVAGTMPAENVEVTVTYNVNSYTLTIHYVYDDNTTAAPDHIEAVNYGVQYSVASPVIDGFTADQTTVSGIMPAQNVEHTVRYTAIVTNFYIIRATAGANGTITPSGDVTVEEGATQTFTITPDEGYRIATVMVDGTNAIDDVIDYMYTFNNVRADHTIDVTFTPSDAIDEYTAGSISVYPNPNNGMFSIDFSSIEGDATYQLIDARGAMIESRDINVMNGETMNFNHSLRPGTYFVRIISNDKVYVEQIVVE